MNKYVLSVLIAVFGLSITSKSQNLGINEDGSNPDASSILDIKASNKGLLIPRVAINNVNLAAPVTSPAEGLLVYNETGTEPTGFYYWNGTMWVKLSTGSSSGPWDRVAPNTFLVNEGDSVGIGTDTPDAKLQIVSKSNNIPFSIQASPNQTNTMPLVNLEDDAGNDLIWINSDHPTNLFLGTDAGRTNTANASPYPYPIPDGLFNLFIGKEAGYDNTTGYSNHGIGYQVLTNNTTGQRNTAMGSWAMRDNTTGINNSGIGNQALRSNTTGNYNSAIGTHALSNNSTANNNVAIGTSALYSQSFSNGGTNWNSDNIAIGYEALYSNQATSTSNGYRNVAMGTWALRSNTIGYHNTAVGHYALWSNTTAIRNSAFGGYALADNTTGTQNTALGYLALAANTTGSGNIAVGVDVLRNSTSGTYNVGIGNWSLYNNVSGNQNIAIGYYTFASNTTSSYNIAIGHNALSNQSFDNGGLEWDAHNIAIGYNSLAATNATTTTNGYRNTSIGVLSLDVNSTGYSNSSLGYGAGGENTTGFRNTYIGYAAGNSITTGDYNTFLGYATDLSDGTLTNSIAIGGNGNLGITVSNRARIGNASMTSIGGQVGWTTVSDARLKSNVQEDVSGLNFIMKLRPVTYNYKIENYNKIFNIQDSVDYNSKYDIEKIKFSGFLAQEVEQAALQSNYDFSGVDKPGTENDIYGLRYAEFVVPMVKAMQEQQQMIDDLKKRLDEQDKLIQKLEKEKANK